MYRIEPYFQASPSICDTSTLFIKDKNKAFSSPLKKIELKLAVPLSQHNSSLKVSRETTQTNQISFEDSELQTNRPLSPIEDPLWKKICSEVEKLMGSSSIQEIWDSELGSFCSEDKSIELCCPTEEAAQFINQYSFLILGSLQRYFPAIRALKTKVRCAASNAYVRSRTVSTHIS
ncbi:MAG: hypothetical protein K2P93_01920 [Alphaproteobacteria bacterium]|nr:hypothetical protein [Alphaproteobacteria bacterium]